MSRRIENRSETIESGKLHSEITNSNGKIIILSYAECFGIFHILEGRLIRVYAVPKESRNDEIVLARVSNVKKDINAAFVKISDDTEAFLKFPNIPEKLQPVKQGMLIPVKIISDEQKGKRISVSAKIPKSKLPEGWEHKSAYNILYKPENSLYDFIKKRFRDVEYDEIVTDDEEAAETLKSASVNVRFYDDEKITLSGLYSINTKLSEALSSKVYLKSGAYLVINHTEALTVIDVNSGKNTPAKKADSKDVFFNINKEAAKEIALQLKLRNISGMILVDFINMDSEENEVLLIDEMNEYVKSDNVKVCVIDITKLGIMEITRQKTDKPLSEMAAMLK